jgi:hypothetical protein
MPPISPQIYFQLSHFNAEQLVGEFGARPC